MQVRTHVLQWWCHLGIKRPNNKAWLVSSAHVLVVILVPSVLYPCLKWRIASTFNWVVCSPSILAHFFCREDEEYPQNYAWMVTNRPIRRCSQFPPAHVQRHRHRMPGRHCNWWHVRCSLGIGGLLRSKGQILPRKEGKWQRQTWFHLAKPGQNTIKNDQRKYKRKIIG